MTSGSPPSRVQECDRPFHGIQEVDRNTVGYGYGEENALCCRRVTVQPLELDPSLCRAVELDCGLVHLVTQDCRVEARIRSPEGPPPAHHVVHRRLGPESQVESPALCFASASDPRYHAVAFAPAGDFEAGDRTGGRRFSKR